MDTIGLIIGHRDVFPPELSLDARKVLLKVLKEEGIEVISLSPGDSLNGTTGNFESATKCAKLFAQSKGKITGILVSLPDFGDERSIAEAIRRSELNVPVLVHAFPDKPHELVLAKRRDSFCGKISVCNNLHQYGIKYSLTSSHTVDPESDQFKSDLRSFIQTCRIVKGLKNVRFGQIGTRPANFATVRYSEKILERHAITIIPFDLSDVLGQNEKVKENDPETRAKFDEVRNYLPSESIPSESIMKMARLGVTFDRFVKENELSGVAVQCWSSLQTNYGIFPCTLMSMLSNNLIPSACETDVSGIIGMYALSLASQKPSALLDWNNNHGESEDKAIVFHCSNIPRSFFKKGAKMAFNAVSANVSNKETAFGSIFGALKTQKVTYCRVTTNDCNGSLKAYYGEGNILNEKVKTFGGYGIAKIPEFQKLMKYICNNGFEHHVAVTQGSFGKAIDEAFNVYLGYDNYYHPFNK